MSTFGSFTDQPQQRIWGGRRTLKIGYQLQHYCTGETGVKLGDKVVDVGGMTGLVVANIDRNQFSPEYPSAHWAYLDHGVLVETEEAGLVHYPSPADLTLTSNP